MRKGHSARDGGTCSDRANLLRWCLSESILQLWREKLATSRTLCLIRDERKGKLLLRFRGCSEKLTLCTGTFGCVRMKGGSAEDIVTATAKAMRVFCTSCFQPPRLGKRLGLQGGLDKQLFAHLREITHILTTDSHPAELLASNIMKGNRQSADAAHNANPFLPNVVLVGRDAAHASTRLVKRPWACIPAIQDREAGDTERRALTILCMEASMDKDVIAGARRLYAAAVKKHNGKQKRPRMDKGVIKGRFPTSEASFLKRKRDSVRAAMASTQRGHVVQHPEVHTDKALKEIRLQKQRRLNRAIDAAENGYLLNDDDDAGPAFAKVESQKRKHQQQDAKRIETLAVRKQICQTVCQQQLWNWKSLGCRNVWMSSVMPAEQLHPLVAVPDPRQASVFITCNEAISDKVYLLAMATGGIILCKSVLQGAGGLRLEYQLPVFRRLRDYHVGIHCSRKFREQHPEFVKTLAWVVEKEGWRRLKASALDKKKSICLLAQNDPDGRALKSKALLTFSKQQFVSFLANKCQSKEKSFFVKSS
eukprot:Skav230602  [mRNA]  locus=scaffold168:102306:105294:- [translate_table: standard]